MRKMSKIQGLLFDAAVLVAVLGALGLACALGSAPTIETAQASAHQVAQAKFTLQSVVED